MICYRKITEKYHKPYLNYKEGTANINTTLYPGNYLTRKKKRGIFCFIMAYNRPRRFKLQVQQINSKMHKRF